MKFVPEEDRLLLRISTTQQELLQFYLTRRYVKILWAPLSKVLLADPSFQTYDEEAQRAVFAFEHEKQMSQANTQQKFDDTKVKEQPVGGTPLLLTKTELAKLPDAKPALGIRDQQGRGIVLAAGSPALHYLYRMLITSVPKIGWELTLEPIEHFRDNGDQSDHQTH